MKLAAAQIKPFKQNTQANIRKHLQMIELAAKQKVNLIVFPEMSLTGYERELADELSFSENDERLTILKEKAVFHKMVIIVGAPIKINSQLHIGSFIIFPDNTVTIYTKQFLHDGEEEYFSSSFAFNPTFKLNDENVSIAICADINNPLHVVNASKNNTTLYIASIFYTPNGIAKAYKQLSAYAKQYAMSILMANYAGVSYNLESAGRSAFWNNKGELTGALEEGVEGLLISEYSDNTWRKI